MRLRLYILSNSAPSDAAVANLKAIVQTHLAGHCELEIVDVRNEPLRAMNEGALMLPTLILSTERGVRKIVGDLTDTQALLRALGVAAP